MAERTPADLAALINVIGAELEVLPVDDMRLVACLCLVLIETIDATGWSLDAAAARIRALGAAVDAGTSVLAEKLN